MAAGGADIWVCGNCRSVNNLRAKQCYHCRTPQQLAAVDPAAIQGTGHGQLREIALPEFHASRGEAMLASALIGLVIVMQILSTVASSSAVMGLMDNPVALNDLGSDEFQAVMSAGFIGLATIGVAILALAAWAYWLSRAVVAMPALGLGYPPTNGLMAFVENFIPGLNLFRVPAIVRDMNRRLDPNNGRGEALIFAAWVGLFGGWLLPRVLGFLNAFGADTLETAVRNAIIFQGIATGLVIVGAIFLVVLIWWIEARIARRRVAQLAGEAAQGSVGGAPSEGVPATAALASTAAQADFGSRPLAQRAPFAPAAPTEATPLAPQRPFAPTPATAGSGAVATAGTVAGPLGAVRSAPSLDAFVNRPITAVTGASALPDLERTAAAADEQPDVERFADARPVWADPPTVPDNTAAVPADAVETVDQAVPAQPIPPPAEPILPPAEPIVPIAPAAESVPTPADPAGHDAEAALAHAPIGPRLEIRVESGTSMIAILDGESESITIDELGKAAGALARAEGSAEVTTTTATIEAKALAQRVVELLSGAGVPTTLQD